MFYSHQELISRKKVEGVKIKITNQVDQILMTELELRKGAILPEHQHKSEHSGYVLHGSIRMYIDGIARELKLGDSWCIAKNTSHHTEAIEDSLLIEVYNYEIEDLKYYQEAVEVGI